MNHSASRWLQETLAVFFIAMIILHFRDYDFGLCAAYLFNSVCLTKSMGVVFFLSSFLVSFGHISDTLQSRDNNEID